jgi:hypothetical protein
MKLLAIGLILSVLMTFKAGITCAKGPGMMGGGWVGGYGPVMMGGFSAAQIPEKLPTPKNDQWVEKLEEVLTLERVSLAQYESDQAKYKVHLPCMMVIPQEQDHLVTIERLFAAHALNVDRKPWSVMEMKTLTEAYEICTKLESDLIPVMSGWRGTPRIPILRML